MAARSRHSAGGRGRRPHRDALGRETEAWITEHLGPDYPCPGTVRELEQCVRNVMIRGKYRPPRRAARGVREQLPAAILAGSLTADEMLLDHVSSRGREQHSSWSP